MMNSCGLVSSMTQRVAEVFAGVLGTSSELLFNAQDLVVFGKSLTSTRRSRLYLDNNTKDSDLHEDETALTDVRKTELLMSTLTKVTCQDFVTQHK